MQLFYKFSILCIFLFLFISCEVDHSDLKDIDVSITGDTSFVELPIQEALSVTIPISALEQKIIDHGLVSVPDSLSNVLVDLKYASTDNFMKMNMYGTLSKAYLQEEVMQKLAKSSAYLNKQHPGMRILIYDAVRPRSVQQMMWDSLKMPVYQKTKFVSNPKNGSIHNFGCAIDLTLADADGNPIDMGAGYDDIRKIAYPRYEKKYLDSGMVTQEHIDNRNLLREVMRKGGFWGIQTEWWHFNAMRREAAKSKFEIVE